MKAQMLNKKIPVKIPKVRLLKDIKHFSVWQLFVFVLVFSSIGGFFAFRSFGLVCACATGPTTPSNLTATAASSSQINLSWGASTESSYNGGFYYHIYRNGSQVDIVTSTSWSSTGLSASTTYSYYVEAYDTYGNASGLSNTATATTLNPPPPPAPTGFSARAVSTSEIDLSWTASPGATGYLIFRNGGQINTTTSTVYKDSGLAAYTTYTYFVESYTQSVAYTSSASNTASATTAPSNIPLPPTTPTNLTATAVSSSQINLSWTASTSQGDGVSGYEVFRNGSLVNKVFITSWSDTGLSASTTYSYYLVAVSNSGEESGASNTASATTLAPPPPPTVPTGLSAETLDDSEIDLNWTASTSSAGIGGYKIYRNGSLIGSTSSTTVSDTGSSTAYYDSGLASYTTYSYQVVAIDNNGIASSLSNTVAATTQSTTPPSAPTSFKATVTSSSTVTLSWTASTVNQAGLKEYDIYEVTPPDDTDDNGVLDGLLIGSTTGTSYQVGGLSASTDYGFYVIAVDITGNFSEESTEALATTNAPGYAINVGLSASVTEIGNNTTGVVINTAISGSYQTCTKKFDSDGSATDPSWSGSFSGISSYSQTVHPPNSSQFYTFYSYELSCTNGASTAVSGIAVRQFVDNLTN
jgi:fibronectin type 3 domain-containing protein